LGHRRGRGTLEPQHLPPRFGTGRAGRALYYEAFIPDPIRDLDLHLGVAAIGLVSEAETAVRDLNGSPQRLASLEGLARQLLRTEALASSAIEGLVLSHRRLAQAVHDPRARDHRAHEVLGNMRAMEAAIDLGAEAVPLRTEDLQDLHRILAVDTFLEKHGGVIREEPGWIGGTTPANASYVAPPPDLLAPLLLDLCEFANRTDLPAVVQAAIAHAQFELIHPFADGNGRVGRCLIHALLRRRGLAENYVPPVSLVLGARRDAYIAGLRAFEADRIGDWVAMFSQATRDAVSQAKRFTDEVEAVQQKWLEEAGRPRRNSAARAILAYLPAYPVIDGTTARRITGSSEAAALRALNGLERAGVLKRRDNRQRSRSWEAPELFELVRSFEERLTVA
jgi:Fic family protein